jgi:hypothetical protein
MKAFFSDSTLDSLVASRQAELSTVMATYSTVSTRLQRSQPVFLPVFRGLLDPLDPHGFGPPESFLFLKKVLSGRKDSLKNKILIQNFSKT